MNEYSRPCNSLDIIKDEQSCVNSDLCEDFDFASGESGVFGGVDAQLSSSIINSPTTSHSKTWISSDQKSKAKSSKIVQEQGHNYATSRNKRRSKIWTAMEIDLFHKALEMFGKHWSKISNFLTTKTPSQVCAYYRKWSEKANVVEDCGSLGDDNCIYLPIGVNEKGHLIPSYVDPHSIQITESLCSSNENEESCFSNNEFKPSGNNNSSEYLYSSLNDWSLGSQVSISDESPKHNVKSDLSSNSHTLSRKKDGKRKKIARLDKNLTNTFKKVRGHACKPKKNVDKSKVNLINTLRPPSMIGGQIVKICKGKREDSDVDIDISDSDEISSSNSFSELICKSGFQMKETKNLNPILNLDKPLQVLPIEKDVLNLKFSPPKCELILDPDSISDEEWLLFLNGGAMNSTQYLKIRRKLITHWYIKKPKHFSYEDMLKLSLKSQLIIYETIFKYLEIKGVINYNHPEMEYDSILKSFYKSLISLKKMANNDSQKTYRKCVGRPKKQDISNVLKGGLTFSHDESGAVIDALHISDNALNVKHRNASKSAKDIKLIRCLEYDPDTEPPFSVTFHPYALAILNFHAHSSCNEVMGLLGGYLDSSNLLHITISEPTEAFESTREECEMCPLSQKAACDSIEENGVRVVGWYHSHPTFPPHPSHQDIETQNQMQNYFHKYKSTFAGIIINPFSSREDNNSDIKCLILDKTTVNSFKNTKPNLLDSVLPFNLKWSVTYNSMNLIDEEKLHRSIKAVCCHQKTSTSWWSECKPGVLLWEKALSSLEFHLKGQHKNFLCLVRNVFLSVLSDVKQ